MVEDLRVGIRSARGTFQAIEEVGFALDEGEVLVGAHVELRSAERTLRTMTGEAGAFHVSDVLSTSSCERQTAVWRNSFPETRRNSQPSGCDHSSRPLRGSNPATRS